MRKKIGPGTKALVISAVALALPALLFLSGPRVDTDPGAGPVTLPRNPGHLEKYIARSERRIPRIIPGTEKRIRWYRPEVTAAECGVTRQKTEYSVVYLHGFSATRQETAPLASTVADRLEANLFATRFTGHGRTGRAMLNGSVRAWCRDTREAVKIGSRLGEKTVVIGVSTGAAAATWYGAVQDAGEAGGRIGETGPDGERARRGNTIDALVLLSPNWAPADKRARILMWPWGEHLARFFIGEERRWEPRNRLHERYWTNRYPVEALLPMMGMVRLVEEASFRRITAPTLVIYSPRDRVVDPHVIEERFEALGSRYKKLVPFSLSEDPSQHILAGDILSPSTTGEVAGIIADFIRQLPTQ
jgi:pimeloyl-ACP methyl ester carboxylesterase